MHLIEKVQDHAKSLVVHAHLVLEIVDQVGAREIHIGEGELVGGPAGDEPFLFDPDRQRGPIEARALQKLPLRDHGSEVLSRIVM